MNRTLTLFPYDAANNAYRAGVTKPLNDWGILDEISGALRSQTADQLNLEFPAGALNAASPFIYRSRLQLAIDNKLFFTGYVVDDVREFSGSANNGQLAVAGPWWYFENLVFQQTINILTGFNPDKTPIYTQQYFTHFTLNLTRTPQISPGTATLIYGTTYLNSQDQIAAVLDWAKANGAYFQYVKADLMAVPVLPRDVMNISCADAIRRQMEDVDAVCWFDHTVDPPMFRCKQRKDLPAISRALGDAYQAQGFKLKRRYDLAVPFVRICFEQVSTYNGQQSINQVFDTYPNPPPADQLKALITTVPLRGYSASTTEKWIKTAAFDPNDLAFWKLRKPEMDRNTNQNADVEYANLAITPNSAQRQSQLPNMIIEGGYADWMGGNHIEDNVTAQATYERKVTTTPAASPLPGALQVTLPGKKLSQHTLRTRVHVTNLNYPNGKALTTTTVSTQAEDPNQFLGLAQIIYTDLNTPQWEGTIPLFEGVYSTGIVLGVNFNLTGGLVEYETMNALAQEISFTSKGGGLFYVVNVGANKKLSPGQLADRLRAKRMAYVTALFFQPAPAGGSKVTLTRDERQDNTSDAEPQKTQDHVFENGGGILLQGNNGQPIFTMQRYDAGGNPLPAGAAGTLVLDYGKLKGSDGKWHGVLLQEQKVCQKIGGVLKQRTVIVPTSEIFQAPDDPA